MRVGNGFEDLVLDIIIYLIAGAAIFLFIQLLVYSTITVKNYRKRKNLQKKFPAWSDQIDDYLKKRRTRARFYLRSEEKKTFRDMLISYYSGESQDPSTDDLDIPEKLTHGEKRRIRMLYRELGFLYEDLNQINDGTAWTKSIAMGRLSRLELNDAEDLAVDLMDSDNKELVISCISYLASIKSRYIDEMLEEIIKKTGDKQFKELMAELQKAEIGTRPIRSLSDSPSIKARKTAAILLGRKGMDNSTQILKRLSIDPDTDIREETVRSLGRIGTVKAGHVLDTMAHDPDPEIRKKASREYKKIRNTTIVTSIWDLETDDKKTDDLLSSFGKESTMEDEGFSITGF